MGKGVQRTMKRWVWLAIAAIFTAGLGCASVPPEKPDSEKIKQDADEAFEDLQREENRTPDDY